MSDLFRRLAERLKDTDPHLLRAGTPSRYEPAQELAPPASDPPPGRRSPPDDPESQQPTVPAPRVTGIRAASALVTRRRHHPAAGSGSR
ncbi:MAG: hypothetical protein JWO63_2634, partial [Frankiales bacterium]|nr:hypothetical protein [Frankiales bacterium]